MSSALETNGATPARGRGEPVLSVHGVSKHFPIRSKGLVRRKVGDVHAVCDVSFDIHENETLCVVGESGCGKSTTGRVVLNLIAASAGEVAWQGKNLTGLSDKRMRPVRRDVQIVFQDPFASLDPRMTVHELIAEPLKIHGEYRGDKAGGDRVRELMAQVGLNPEHGRRYAHEFSGGQRQRIGIARALALRPKLLVLDEPVSALDVSIQAGVINLLEDLQEEFGLSYLFISHDLSVIRHIADRVVVMYLGKVVETADVDELFRHPSHPYTQALMSAIPLPDPIKERERTRILLTGDVPSPVNPPSGCRFRTRCPKFANELDNTQREWCVNVEPPLGEKFTGHKAACHFAAARVDILDTVEQDEVGPALDTWPTGRPSDADASRPMACEPDGPPREPTRLGEDVVVDEEGELVTDAADS
ncbi:oligopeptide transport system ATP-binding protein [Jatrophihabitans endophyticus]|uniref:Oligopeptide transport system ATP-binding protein n=1 Tax=Jatrophihabitans endophyticus TaxID=1206085 RepID=A0A1M5T952_9ACTN|nr:oligopeptide/dipeptide ABC transporter ATP-binding protein [Jatrophihabitans endophyticus]SHH47305.1 oligopeptide transport system ATP-binding protein [Jatrophihabitans endophyticus]